MAEFDNIDRQIEQLKKCEFIKESEVRDLCNYAKDILIEESNIQTIYTPITVSTFKSNLINLLILL